MDGFLTRQVVDRVREVLASAERRKAMVAHNYEVARAHYSYRTLHRQLHSLLSRFFGAES
jgi:hypothetical protein